MDIRAGHVWIFLLLQVVTVVSQTAPIATSDMPPYFSVYENASVGEHIFTVTATDPDPSDKLDISITSDFVEINGSFKFSTYVWGWNVTLKNPLDRETMPSTMQLTFYLSDQQLMPGRFRIIMRIIDVNDNPPNFVNLPYRISIKEDCLTGTSVFKVSATDPDTGLGGVVLYSLTGVNTGSNGTFELQSQENGSIVLVKPLDYEKMSFYHYNVTAKDRGDPTCPGARCQCKDQSTMQCDSVPADLFITIVDVQNSPPVFDKQQYIGTVPENTKVDFSILRVKAVDGDIGVNPQNLIHYSFTAGSNSLFAINETDGVISVNAPLDADLDEVKNKGGLYVFDVTATEVSENASVLTQNPNNSTSVSVSITVTDVNDNPPTFSEISYTATVQENTPVGVPITVAPNIEANDIDQDMNNRFWLYLEKDGDLYNDFETLPKQYSIIPGRSTIFIKVANSSILDYEKTKNITFKIIAKENNSNSNMISSSEATVTLVIEDVNDNSPQFSTQETTFNVSEDASVGYVVATITATDADSGKYGEIEFTLEDDGTENAFNISQKGVIRVAKSLDRETRQYYTLYVVASDNPGTEDQRKKTQRIQINVTDVNDNDPEWTQFIEYVNVLESSPVNMKVTDLRAIDIDEGPNGQIEYSILPTTNGSRLFNITKTGDTGMIAVKESLMDEVGLFLVIVMAEDEGSPRRNKTLTLSIVVIDENQNTPIFVNPNQNEYNSSAGELPVIEVFEEQPVDTVLYTLYATDKDTEQNGLVMYYLEYTTNRDYEYFKVDRFNGSLQSVRTLDREIQEIYEIRVRAEDNGQPVPRSQTLTLRIKLNDTDDNEPKYKPDSMPQLLSVKEENSSAYIGQVLAATDKDLYPNNIICYYLYGGDHLSGLDLNKENRSLALTKKVDREVTEVLNVVIKASANCALAKDFFISTINSSDEQETTSSVIVPPAYNSSDDSLLWVKVAVDDINDNPPQFLFHDLSASTVYDVDIGTEIMSLKDHITDKDTHVNSKNKFKCQSLTTNLEAGDIVDISIKAFVVSGNGSVSTNTRFQSDLKGYFLLKVLAYDDDGLNDTATIRVYLISIFDRVKLVFNRLPNQVEEIRDTFIKQLSDILKLDLVMDKISTHSSSDGTTDPTKTDGYIYGRFRNNGKIVPASQLWQLLDLNTAAKAFLFSNGVTESQALTNNIPTDDVKLKLKIAFAVAVSVLAVIILALLVVLVYMVKLYRRRLRAATIVAFASPKEKETLEPPGTNKYFAAENPLFGKDIKQLDHDYDKISDQTSYNSLDLNTVDEPNSSPAAGPNEEQELFMQITDNNEEFSTKNVGNTSNLDQVLQTYSNEGFQKDDDDDRHVYRNYGQSKPRDDPYSLGSGHNFQESDVYDEIYNINGQAHQNHMEYTEI